jgi:hypothetical protein
LTGRVSEIITKKHIFRLIEYKENPIVHGAELYSVPSLTTKKPFSFAGAELHPYLTIKQNNGHFLL